MPVFTIIISLIGLIFALTFHKGSILGIALFIGIIADAILIIILEIKDKDKPEPSFIIDCRYADLFERPVKIGTSKHTRKGKSRHHTRKGKSKKR